MAKVASKLLTCEFDGSLCLFRFTAEIDGIFAVGSIPVKDLLEAVGRPVAVANLMEEFRRAVGEGFIDLSGYCARSWSPWTPSTDSRFRRVRPLD